MFMIAEVLSFFEDRKNSNVQGFQNTFLLIKVEKFEDQDIQARMFFLNSNLAVELFVVLEDIKVKEINETTNRKKIFTLVPEQKRYIVHNYNKPDNVKTYEMQKCLDKAINIIFKTEKQEE
ncbi:2237_t:CDS:2, partial [Cetraspora pellucida]